MAINSNSAVNRGSGFLTVVGAVFAVVGSAAGVSTLRKEITGIVDVKQIVLGFTMALMFAGAGIGLIVWSRVSAKSVPVSQRGVTRQCFRIPANHGCGGTTGRRATPAVNGNPPLQ